MSFFSRCPTAGSTDSGRVSRAYVPSSPKGSTRGHRQRVESDAVGHLETVIAAFAAGGVPIQLAA